MNLSKLLELTIAARESILKSLELEKIIKEEIAKEEAEQYRIKHELWVRVPEYIAFRNKWALVFPLKACITVEIDDSIT